MDIGCNNIIEDLEISGEPEEMFYQYHDAMSGFVGLAQDEVYRLQECLQQKNEYAYSVLTQFGITGMEKPKKAKAEHQ